MAEREKLVNIRDRLIAEITSLIKKVNIYSVDQIDTQVKALALLDYKHGHTNPFILTEEVKT